jgi:hypothetical protein
VDAETVFPPALLREMLSIILYGGIIGDEPINGIELTIFTMALTHRVNPNRTFGRHQEYSRDSRI